jgi:hypothetical protein
MVSAVAIRAMARRQRPVELTPNQSCCTAFKPNLHCCRAGNHGMAAALIRSFRREDLKTMRWKLSHGHDPRQIDLVAVFALLIIIVTAFLFFAHRPEPSSTTAFIVPSQSVRW